MSVIWYKVWSDLWKNKVRTILAVLSIAVGVFAIGAIFGMADQLLTGMDTSHQNDVPSHLNMYLQERIDQDTAIRLKTIEGLEDIEVLNFVSIRYKLKPEDEWQPGTLAMHDDYEAQKFDILQLKAGEWPKKNNIGIERLSSQHFGIDIGDKVIFELDGTDRALAVTGRVRANFVEPPQFGGNAVFFVDAQGLERFNVPAGEFNNLKVQVKPYSRDLAQTVASEIKNRLAKEGIGVAVTFYQTPDKHWGRFIVEGITLVLQVLAILSLFMSVVLVTNTMTALITQQTHQIGVIKAIGGKTKTIIMIYLAGVVIYGLLALLIALPPAALLAFGMTQNFLNMFNIDYNVFQVSTRAVVLQIVAALAVPLLAALWPVLSGAGTTVRAAIASYGLGGGHFGTNWFDQVIERAAAKVLASPYAIALGNTFRRKGRLILTQLVLVAAGTMFLIVMSLSSSITASLDNDFARRGYDIRLGFDDTYRIDRLLKMATDQPGVAQAEVWFTHSASVLKEGQRLKDAGIGADLMGIPAGSQMYRPLMVAGRWLQPDDGRVVVIRQKMADDNDIGVGDVVTLDLGELGDDQWQVVGIYQVFANDDFDADPIYALQNVVFDTTKKYNQGDRLLVRTQAHNPETVDTVNRALKTAYETRQMDVNSFDSGMTFEDRESSESEFAISISMLLALAIIVAVVGGIGLMGSLSISVVERTREIGVMRAIGARSVTMLGMFVMEGILQGLLSWSIAVPLSFVFGRSMAAALGQTMFDTDLDYLYNFDAVFVWLVIILVISTLASIIPARNATRVSVRESLAYA
ncbi:MAG: FtsX-like permease family protein [Anaerolineae bacterium]|nr:FtsX-like permease family protein [Anaerolineae bacterium]